MLTSKGSWKELMDNPTVQSFYFKSIKKYEKNIALRSIYNRTKSLSKEAQWNFKDAFC